MCNTYIMKFVLLLACALSCIYIHCAYAEIVSVNLSYTDKVHFAVYEKLLKKNGMTAFFRPTKRFGVTWVFADARNTPIVFKGYIDAQMYTLECLSFTATTCTLTKSNDNIEDYKMKPARGRHLCLSGSNANTDDDTADDTETAQNGEETAQNGEGTWITDPCETFCNEKQYDVCKENNCKCLHGKKLIINSYNQDCGYCLQNGIYESYFEYERCTTCGDPDIYPDKYVTVNIGNETEQRQVTYISSSDRTQCIESIFNITDAQKFCGVNEWIQGSNLNYNIVNDPPEERHNCGACPEGQYRNKDEIGCSPCNKDARGLGNWKVIEGVCTNCNGGEVYDEYTRTCKKCGVGLYAGVRYGQPACLVCFNGADNKNPVDNYLYQDEEGQTSCKECEWNLPYRAGECRENEPRCHAGYMYVGAPKSPHRNMCYRCSRGRYLSNKTRGETCKNCPSGFYRNAKGATYCKQCPVGYTHTHRRQWSLRECKNSAGVSYLQN